jgi:phosphomannomutase
MKINYLFDVDGTLTPPRAKMTDDFAFFFLDWMRNKNVYLVTGSDREKVIQQVPCSILAGCKGVFSSMANEFRSEDQLVYSNDWRPSPKLVKDLTMIRVNSDYTPKRENFIEHRKGMINFSVAGRDSTMKQRAKYYAWDKETEERGSIVKKLRAKYKRLEFCLGGEISIDIQPKGKNKAQASKWIRKHEGGKIVFFGDRCMEGGNDYDIVEDIKKNKRDEYFQVDNSLTTRKLLESHEE